MRAKATAFIVIGPDGTPTLHETIYVEPTATAAEGRGGTTGGSNEDEDGAASGAPTLGKPLRDELAVRRTKLLGLHLANDPGMAVDLGIFLLADAQASRSYSSERGSSLRGHGRTTSGATIPSLRITVWPPSSPAPKWERASSSYVTDVPHSSAAERCSRAPKARGSTRHALPMARSTA